jgi:DNA-binding NarL/FixJ family response regulator
MHPDLIILDIWMPVLDGLGAAMEIRHFLPEVPILFLSGNASEGAALAAKLVGAQGLVEKDKAGRSLTEAVDTVMHGGVFFCS